MMTPYQNNDCCEPVSMKKRKIFFVITIVVIGLSIHFISLFLFGTFIFFSEKSYVYSLSGSLQIVEKYGIRVYQNLHWCNNFVYRRGKFSNDNETGTCNLFEGDGKAFDELALKDFAVISRSLSRSQVSVAFFTVDFNKKGRIEYGQFHIGCILCNRKRYVFNPGYGKVPQDIPDEMWFTPIDENWYYITEDWN